MPAPVTVGAPDLALLDFGFDGFEIEAGRDHLRNLVLLVAHVVELKDDLVPFAAVHARMRVQVFGDKRPGCSFPVRLIFVLALFAVGIQSVQGSGLASELGMAL